MIIACAWCKRDQGEKPPYEDNSVTHGICRPCMQAVMGSLQPHCKGCGRAATGKLTLVYGYCISCGDNVREMVDEHNYAYDIEPDHVMWDDEGGEG